MEYKFIHMSDLHLSENDYAYNGNKYNTNKLFSQALEEIKAIHKDIDFIIISGDLAENGAVGEYRYLKSCIEKHSEIPVYLCLGNHDIRGNFNKVFLNKDSDEPFFFCETLPKGQMRIIVVDSGKFNPWMGEICPLQLGWLEKTIGLSSLPVILMIHHPPFLGEDMDSLLYQLKNTRDLFGIIEKARITGIFSGHVHANYSYRLGNTLCFTSEGTGFGLGYKADYSSFPTDKRGYNLCFVKGGNIAVKRVGFEM